jgi:hypothetical protein
MKHLRPEIVIIATNYMPKVASDFLYEFKKMF